MGTSTKLLASSHTLEFHESWHHSEMKQSYPCKVLLFLKYLWLILFHCYQLTRYKGELFFLTWVITNKIRLILTFFMLFKKMAKISPKIRLAIINHDRTWLARIKTNLQTLVKSSVWKSNYLSKFKTWQLFK